MTELQPWHQQPGETSKAFAAFGAYRRLDPSERSISRVVSDLGKSRSTIGGWSSKWDWVERATAWDEEEDRRLGLSRIEAKKKMDEEHLRIVRTARNKAVKALAEVDLTGCSLSELRYWLDTFMHWERLILGEPETIVERRTKVWPHRDYDLEKEMEELQPIIEDMYRRGVLSDESWDISEEEDKRSAS